jgi:hypothetical protein
MRVPRGRQRRGDGSPRMDRDVREIWRIRVEIMGFLKAGEVRGRVREQKGFFRDAAGNRAPDPRGAARAQAGCGLGHASRLLGVPIRAVFGAPGVVEQEHGSGLWAARFLVKQESLAAGSRQTRRNARAGLWTIGLKAAGRPSKSLG